MTRCYCNAVPISLEKNVAHTKAVIKGILKRVLFWKIFSLWYSCLQKHTQSIYKTQIFISWHFLSKSLFTFRIASHTICIIHLSQTVLVSSCLQEVTILQCLKTSSSSPLLQAEMVKQEKKRWIPSCLQ